MKVPKKYEPKNTDEFGTFDRAMTRLLAVPADELQRKIKRHKRRKKKSKSSDTEFGLGWPSGSEIEEAGKEGFAAMMGQGFGDEIGRGLIRMVLLCIACVGVGYGLSIVLNWLLRHIAIHWK